MPANPQRTDLEQQETPVVQVVGKISGDDPSANGSNAKYLLHTGWTRKTYQVSNRGLKVIRTMDIKVIDDPADYTV